jgi:hypothetical protein
MDGRAVGISYLHKITLQRGAGGVCEIVGEDEKGSDGVELGGRGTAPGDFDETLLERENLLKKANFHRPTVSSSLGHKIFVLFA